MEMVEDLWMKWYKWWDWLKKWIEGEWVIGKCEIWVWENNEYEVGCSMRMDDGGCWWMKLNEFEWWIWLMMMRWWLMW